MRLRDLHKSVVFRLGGSALLALLLATAGTIGLDLLRAPARIRAEIRSSMNFAEIIIDGGLRSVASAASAEDAKELARRLDAMRHIDVQYVPLRADAFGLPKPGPRSTHAAPGWFVALLDRSPARVVYPVLVGGRERGALVVTGSAYDEIDEVWVDLRHDVLQSAAAMLILSVLMVWMARATLRPIRAVADGMDRMCRGEFIQVEDSDIAELRELGERFNTLATALRGTGEDNRLLIDRLLTIQEDEREEIARALHDEFGATLFSIRAELMALRTSCPEDSAAAERIGELETLIEDVQWRNRRLLEWMRPMVLDHLSLADAVREMVEGWRARAEQTDWEAEIDDDIGSGDKAADLAIYRIVQECLTNAGRHAHARHVSVRLRRGAPSGPLQAEIADDGVGLPRDLRFGYGLLGATERARRFGGSLQVERRERGTAIRFSLPAQRAGAPGAATLAAPPLAPATSAAGPAAAPAATVAATLAATLAGEPV